VCKVENTEVSKTVGTYMIEQKRGKNRQAHREPGVCVKGDDYEKGGRGLQGGRHIYGVNWVSERGRNQIKAKRPAAANRVRTKEISVVLIEGIRLPGKKEDNKRSAPESCAVPPQAHKKKRLE